MVGCDLEKTDCIQSDFIEYTHRTLVQHSLEADDFFGVLEVLNP